MKIRASYWLWYNPFTNTCHVSKNKLRNLDLGYHYQYYTIRSIIHDIKIFIKQNTTIIFNKRHD